MVFSANDHVLIKLLRQVKRYGAKRFIAEFFSKPWILLGLKKLLRKIDTSRFELTSLKFGKLIANR